MDGSEPQVYSLAQSARLLNISRSGAYAMARDGELPVILIRKTMKVPRVALERLIEERLREAEHPDRGRPLGRAR